MLQEHTKFEKNEKRLDEFAMLEAKMKQSLGSLTHIRNLLGNKQTITALNQDRISQLEQNCLDLQSELVEKDRLLLQSQNHIEYERNRYTELEQKFNELTRQSNLQQEDSQKELCQLQNKYSHLQTENRNLSDMMHELQRLHELEVQRKERLDLLLRESAQELKNTTEAALERDQMIEELQQNLEQMHQQVDEKNQIIETYASKESEEMSQMQEELVLLEEANKRLSQELRDTKKKQIEEQRQKEDNSNNMISSLEQELIACQSQLLEKKSQNQELESAMERVNQHCNVLRMSLNEATQESAERYQKILSYRDDIRLLKQALHKA